MVVFIKQENENKYNIKLIQRILSYFFKKNNGLCMINRLKQTFWAK